MSKFKVGDKVKIASKSICDHYEMLGMKVGDVVEVSEVEPVAGCGDTILVEHDCLPVLVRLSDVELVEQ
jgi:ribosomal protein S17